MRRTENNNWNIYLVCILSLLVIVVLSSIFQTSVKNHPVKSGYTIEVRNSVGQYVDYIITYNIIEKGENYVIYVDSYSGQTKKIESKYINIQNIK